MNMTTWKVQTSLKEPSINNSNDGDVMSHLVISKKNEVFLKIEAEPHVYYELSDSFTFEVPGVKYMPSYQKKYWDGKIR